MEQRSLFILQSLANIQSQGVLHGKLCFLNILRIVLLVVHLFRGHRTWPTLKEVLRVNDYKSTISSEQSKSTANTLLGYVREKSELNLSSGPGQSWNIKYPLHLPNAQGQV